MRYLALFFLLAIASLVGAQNRSNRIVGGGSSSVSTAASLVYDTVVTNATILDAEMDGLFTQYDRVNAYLTVNVSATLTEGIQLPGTAYVDDSYLGKSLYVFAADSSATYEAYVSSADFGGIRLLDGSYSSVYYFQDGESVLFTLTQSNGEYKWVAQNAEQEIQSLAAQIGNLQPDQRITIYQAAHGFSLPSHGFIPVYQDTSGKINQANLLHEDSTHAYYVIAIPDVDSLTIISSGNLTVSGGHGLKIGKTYYTAYWNPIDTLQDEYYIDFIGSPINDSTMNLGLGLTIINKKNTGARVAVEPEYTALLDYWATNSITLPDENVKVAHNALITGLKASGAWDIADFVHVEASMIEDPLSGLTNWKNPGTYDMQLAGILEFGVNVTFDKGYGNAIHFTGIAAADNIGFTAANQANTNWFMVRAGNQTVPNTNNRSLEIGFFNGDGSIRRQVLAVGYNTGLTPDSFVSIQGTSITATDMYSANPIYSSGVYGMYRANSTTLRGYAFPYGITDQVVPCTSGTAGQRFLQSFYGGSIGFSMGSLSSAAMTGEIMSAAAAAVNDYFTFISLN